MIEEKYLPSKEYRKEFLFSKIEQNQKEVYGNYLEIVRAELRGDKVAKDNAEHIMPQLYQNQDMMEKELKNLGE